MDDISRKMGLGTDEPAVTDRDCTPRPRFRESQADFHRRIAGMEAEVAKLKSGLRAKNRRAALQPPIIGADGISVYFTQCACGWCGLRVVDPEVARRQYDEHACSMGTEFTPGQTLHRTTESTLIQQGWVEKTKALLEKRNEDAPVVETVKGDGSIERFALLELK